MWLAIIKVIGLSNFKPMFSCIQCFPFSRVESPFTLYKAFMTRSLRSLLLYHIVLLYTYIITQVSEFPWALEASVAPPCWYHSLLGCFNPAWLFLISLTKMIHSIHMSITTVSWVLYWRVPCLLKFSWHQPKADFAYFTFSYLIPLQLAYLYYRAY